MTSPLRLRALRLAPCLLGLIGAVYLVQIAVDSRPIADDWWFISDARRWSFDSYMQTNLGSSGRFSQFALAWLSSRAFGAAAVSVLPLVLLALEVGFVAWIVRAGATLLDIQIGHLEAALLALLAVVSALAATPSLYDTVAWFAAAVAYLAGAVAATALAALCLSRLAGSRPDSLISASGLALLAAIAAGFHEIIGATIVLAGLLAICTVRDLGPSDRNRRLLVPFAGTILGAALGTAANVFGPGAQSRAHAQSAHISLMAALHTAANNISFLRADAHDGVLLLAFATGVATWLAVGPVRELRVRHWLFAWTVFLMLVPWMVTAALTAWGGSTESGDRSPFRAAFVGTGSVTIALALGVWLVLSIYPTLLSQTRAILMALVLALAGTLGLAHKADPIVRAEAMRVYALNARATSVRRQLAAGKLRIDIIPAPLLTVFTQAYDLSFTPTDQQRAGWVSAVRQYYGIPSREGVAVISRQPRDYCLPGVDASWVGVRSCQELAQHG